MVQYRRFSEEYQFREEPSDIWLAIDQYIVDCLGDITKDENLLRDLYVPITTRKYDHDMLAARLIEIPPLRLREFEEGNSAPVDFPNLIHNVISKSKEHKLFFILAPMGYGKTTFLHYELRITLPKKFKAIEWKYLIIDVTEHKTKINVFITYLEHRIDTLISESFPCFHAKTDEDLNKVHKVNCEIFKQILLNERVQSTPADINNNYTRGIITVQIRKS